jgi:hypothetical protein
VGVAVGLPLEFIKRDLLLSADISLPVFLLDFQHYEFNLAGRVRLFNLGFISFVNRLGFFLMGTQNDIYGGTTFGVKESLLIGYFGEIWYLAGEAGYDKPLMTYVAHTDLYKTTVYAEAVDGWYASPAGRFRVGLQGGVRLFRRLGINARIGYTVTERLNEYTLPFYGNISVSFQF